jgi:hypothetical protein
MKGCMVRKLNAPNAGGNPVERLPGARGTTMINSQSRHSRLLESPEEVDRRPLFVAQNPCLSTTAKLQ